MLLAGLLCVLLIFVCFLTLYMHKNDTYEGTKKVIQVQKCVHAHG